MPNYQSTRQGTRQIADVNYLSKDFDSIKYRLNRLFKKILSR